MGLVMNVQARTTALYCATLAGLLVLSACGKNQEASAYLRRHIEGASSLKSPSVDKRKT